MWCRGRVASYDGGGFEEWVRSSLYGDISEEKIQQVLKLLAPFRKEIEYQLDEVFDPEEHSWRDFRNALWVHIPEGTQQDVDAILQRVRTRFERVQ